MENFDINILNKFKKNYHFYIKNINSNNPLSIILTFCCINILIDNKFLKEKTPEYTLALWSNIVFTQIQSKFSTDTKLVFNKILTGNQKKLSPIIIETYNDLKYASNITDWFLLYEEYINEHNNTITQSFLHP